MFNLFQMNTQTMIITIVIRAFIVIAVLPFHEFAHAWTASKLGDRTAEVNGRLTLDPFRHIDPIGGLMILLLGFGWAKPVPVNPYNFKNRKAGMAITAAAGPISNLIAAFAGIAVYNLLWTLGPANLYTGTDLSFGIRIAFDVFVSVNISLAIFNMIPINPLDGSRILALFLPDRISDMLEQYQMYLYMAVIALMATNVLSVPMGIAANGIMWLFSLPFPHSPYIVPFM